MKIHAILVQWTFIRLLLIFILIFPQIFPTLSFCLGCAVCVRCSSSAALKVNYGILLCGCFGIDGPHHIGESENLARSIEAPRGRQSLSCLQVYKDLFPSGWLRERGA